MGKLFTEFVGTFFLVLTFGLCASLEALQVALAVGGMLAALTYMGSHVSGAHYNPAVTLMVALRGAMNTSNALPYMGAQLLGGLAASLMVLTLDGSSFSPSPSNDLTALGIVLIELLFAFIFCLVGLRTTTVEEVADNSYYGLALGLVLMVAILAIGPRTSAALNPALAFGTVVTDVWMGTGGYKHLWIYLVGPFGGAGLAAVAFWIQRGD